MRYYLHVFVNDTHTRLRLQGKTLEEALEEVQLYLDNKTGIECLIQRERIL